MERFAHLHLRSGFSYGFGIATPEELVEATGEMGVGSIALTDRDGLYGTPRLLKVAGEVGVDPVVGAEVSVEGGGHLVLLVEGVKGYRSLSKLITSYRCSSEERRKPLCPLPTLLNHVEGLICLTGAVPFGLLPRLVLSDNSRKAKEILGRLLEAFGQENVFVELTDDLTMGSRRRLRRVAIFAKEQRVPVLATNEVAYPKPEDHRLHEVLVAASNLTRLPGPRHRPTDQLYLKPSEKMERLFEDYPEALKNAAEVAERCSGAVSLGGETHMPTAHLPEGETPKKKLIRLVSEGAKKRYGKPDERVRSRLRRELKCIGELGFASYFLLAHEAKEVAEQKGVPVTGRGSAANSLVSYCLGLTQPEPFSNRLLFERFLHEHREDPPDIDLDLCSERRDEVRDELIGRYDRHGVAVAATANTLSLRGAVRVAARALGYAPKEINRLSRHVPTRFTDRDRLLNPISGWEEALREPAMKGHPMQDRQQYTLLLGLSWKLAGRLHQAGTHLGGLVFGNETNHLSELVPLEPSGQPGLLRCQYDKDDLEYVGLPKLDLLGLRIHTALHKAGELASKRLGRRAAPYEPPPGDKETYALIRTGKNAGMFQLESPGQMHLSCRLKPRRFSDLVAQISLFRPGPVRGDLVTPYVLRRNGLEPYSVPLEELEEVLKPTHGVLIFQEQVLEVAAAVAGFSFTEGDLIRRAMTKDRGPGAMSKLREEFVSRAVGRGVAEAKAREIFEWMEGFSVYGFSAAHAASFASLSYASAYMRCHHPAEFFCALLSSQPMGFYSPRVLLNEARRIGIGVLPPDVHLSGKDFTVEEDGSSLRVGLSYCKGLSEKAISSIVSERCRRPFSSVGDLYQRTRLERDSLENLIKGGFLDTLVDRGGDRRRLLEEVEVLPKKRSHERQPEIPMPHPASWWAARENRNVEHLPPTETQRERSEWEVLGLNIRRHPLSPYREALRKLGVTQSEAFKELPHGTRVRVAGLLECLQCPPTKSGRPVWFLLVEDEWGLLQATIFRGVYERYGDLLHHRGAFLLEGRVENTPEKGFSFLVKHIRDLGEVLSEARMPTPKAVSASGAFLRAGRRGRRRAG
jgi:error-prone DNA polymerase